MSDLKPQDEFTSQPASSKIAAASNSLIELRTSVRFPVRMHVKIQTANGEKEDAETINVSASGLLLAFSRVLEEGSAIEVEMVMPSQAMGTLQDVVVHCQGRVIRSYRKSNTQVEVATVIDTYRMIS